jgi:diguanylate cyclase (GGDEF)-like protein
VHLSSTDDHLALIRRIVAGSWVGGGVAALSVLLQADANPSDHRALAILGSVEILIGVAAHLATRTPRWLVEVLLFGGILAVSAAVAISRPVGPAPFFYLWPMITIAYFMSRRAVAAGLVIMLATLVPALAINPDEPNRHTIFIGTLLTIALTAFIVMLLKERLQALVGELRVTAATDPLTGLLNRRAFNGAFERELDRAHSTQLPLTLVLIDIDHFKLINDRHGHAAGDAALVRFARLLESECVPGDLVARIGGEEFAVVLFSSDVTAAQSFVSRLASRLDTQLSDDGVAFTVSAGIAAAHQVETAEELMLGADRALYAAKAAGRDRVEIWNGQLAPLQLMGEPSVSRAPRAAAS